MNFKELLEGYKNGTLTDDERIYVENEIEKNESINEFLADQIDFNINNTELTDDEIDNNKIKTTVNNRLRKVAIISALIVFSILISTKYIIFPIIDSFYYKPNRMSIDKYMTDFDLSMRSYVELYLPGYAFSGSHVEPLGFGKYNITIGKKDSFKNNTEYTDINIKRNKVSGNIPWLFPKASLFQSYQDNKIKEYQRSTTEKYLNHLRDLPATSYVSAYVDFKKDLSIEELLLLRNTFDNPESSKKALDFRWIAIRAAYEKDYNGIQVGFNPSPQYSKSAIDENNNTKYPYLNLADYYAVSRTLTTSFEKEMGGLYETHFKSLLKYLYDKKDFSNCMTLRYDPSEFYESTLEYIEENGVKTYGVLVYGEVDDIISFMENDITDCLYISNIKISKFAE